MNKVLISFCTAIDKFQSELRFDVSQHQKRAWRLRIWRSLANCLAKRCLFFWFVFFGQAKKMNIPLLTAFSGISLVLSSFRRESASCIVFFGQAKKMNIPLYLSFWSPGIFVEVLHPSKPICPYSIMVGILYLMVVESVQPLPMGSGPLYSRAVLRRVSPNFVVIYEPVTLSSNMPEKS